MDPKKTIRVGATVVRKNSTKILPYRWYHFVKSKLDGYGISLNFPIFLIIMKIISNYRAILTYYLMKRPANGVEFWLGFFGLPVIASLTGKCRCIAWVVTAESSDLKKQTAKQSLYHSTYGLQSCKRYKTDEREKMDRSWMNRNAHFKY
jgi:hypothetical protein